MFMLYNNVSLHRGLDEAVTLDAEFNQLRERVVSLFSRVKQVANTRKEKE